MNLLEVNNICKTYGSGETAVHALKKVSFSVPKGEYVAIVGESGSGKSTLLNMIGALDTPTSGKVVIGGKEIFSMNDNRLTVFRRRNIGFIFQAFNLIPELTVEQNIIFPVLLDYQKPDRKYLEELLTVLNLKERAIIYRASYPAVRGKGWHLPEPLLQIPRCCFWMSRLQRLMQRFVRS